MSERWQDFGLSAKISAYLGEDQEPTGTAIDMPVPQGMIAAIGTQPRTCPTCGATIEKGNQ